MYSFGPGAGGGGSGYIGGVKSGSFDTTPTSNSFLKSNNGVAAPGRQGVNNGRGGGGLLVMVVTHVSIPRLFHICPHFLMNTPKSLET